MKAKILLISRVFISIALVAFLLWSMRGHFSYIATTIAKTNLFLFSMAVLLFMLATCIISLRLKLLFSGEGLNISLGKVLQLTYIGYFFNNFMPSSVGGDIVKAYYAYKQTKETAKSFIAIFMDRFLGLFSFVFMAAFALLVLWKDIDATLKKTVFFFAFFGIIGFLIILNSSVAKIILKLFSKFKLWNTGERLSKVYRAVHEYRNKKGLILVVIGISIVSQSVYFIMVYLLSKSLDANLVLGTVFLIMPIVSVVSMLPSLGGLGLREGAMVALFGPIIGSNAAFSISILLLATLLIISLVGAIIYASASQFKIKPAEITKIESYSV